MTTKLLIVTGASRGLGRSIALAFVRQYCKTDYCKTDNYWKIWLLARDESGLQETRRQIHEIIIISDNLSVDCHVIDLSQLESLSNRMDSILLHSAPAQLSELHFINNAGTVGPIGPCRDLSLAQMRTAFDFNVSSACWLSARIVQWATRTMQCPRTVLVNISSLVAVQAFPSLAVYSAGKAARDLFHSALAQEEEQQVVKVLNYAPGPLETDMTEQLRQAPLLDVSLQPHYQKQLVDPDDSATKLVDILFHQKFQSGQHLDYYDDIYSIE